MGNDGEGQNLGLEGTDEVGEKGILPGERQHPLLHHGAFHIVIDQHHVLLQALDGKVLVFALELGKQDLPMGRMLSKGPAVRRHPASGVPREPLSPAPQAALSHLAKAAFAQHFVEGEVIDVAPAAPLPDLAVGPIVVCGRGGDMTPSSQGTGEERRGSLPEVLPLP